MRQFCINLYSLYLQDFRCIHIEYNIMHLSALYFIGHTCVWRQYPQRSRPVMTLFTRLLCTSCSGICRTRWQSAVVTRITYASSVCPKTTARKRHARIRLIKTTVYQVYYYVFIIYYTRMFVYACIALDGVICRLEFGSKAII